MDAMQHDRWLQAGIRPARQSKGPDGFPYQDKGPSEPRNLRSSSQACTARLLIVVVSEERKQGIPRRPLKMDDTDPPGPHELGVSYRMIVRGGTSTELV